MHKIEGWMFLCAAFIVMALFFLIGMRGYTYISLTLFFLTGLILVHHLGGPVLRRSVAVITGIGLLYFCFVEFLIISNAHTEKDCGRGYLIILGAAVHGKDPSLSLQHRLEGALAYLEEFPDSKAVCSGGQGAGEYISEAECMAGWLAARGIAQERILKEDRSTSTRENLEFSWKIIEADGGKTDDIAVVSSSYHLYRAKAIARSIGLQAAGVCGNPGYPVYMLGMFIREAFGVTHLWILGD